MTAPSWQVISGRCGACLRFVKDFGDVGKAYGHCPPKPRSGAIDSTLYKCDGYIPRPEVAEEERAAAEAQKAQAPKRPSIDVFADPRALANAKPQGRARPARASRPASPARPAEPRKTRYDRDHETVDLWGEEMDRGELRSIIREALEETMGVGEVDLLDRFEGGTVEIRPGRAETQSKEIPIDTLMRKIVMVRDNLRVLEQKINQHPKLSDPDRVQLQQYITRCYGSLTTFNTLFRNKDDRFRGSGS